MEEEEEEEEEEDEDATITNFIDSYNQLNMFRAKISPIRRSTRLCLQLVV